MINRRQAALGLLASVGWRPALAQSYPERPIRLIVPFATGGSSDVMARALGKQLSEQMGVPVLVDNRPGAGGVAMELVARAPADGYTLLYGTIGTNGVAPALFRNLPADPARELQSISLLALTPSVLIVNSSLPVRTLQDLIVYAKARPGKLNYASAGNGSISHLATELLKTSAGITMVHVPYKGGGAASADLLAGNVALMLETNTNALALARTGKVRAIASTASKRSPVAPDLPTFAEAGLPGYAVDSWTGLFAAHATPRPIVDRLHAEVVKAARDAAYRQVMSNMGVETAASASPDEFTAFVQAEQAKWARVVRATGTKVD